MKSKQTPHQIFEKEVTKLYETFVNECINKVNKAREGYKIKQLNGFLNLAREQYNTIIKELDKHARFFLDIKDELEDDKEKTFDELFNQKLNDQTDVNKNILLKRLSQLKALDRFFIYLTEETRKYQPISSNLHSNPAISIKWKGIKELEFV